MNKEEFIQEVRSAEETLYRVALSILRNEPDAADAVQEALLRAYENLHTLRKKQYFKTWLVRILMNECYKIQKRQKRLVSYEEYMQQESGRKDPCYTDLYQAILELPQEMRTAVVLFYMEGFSIEEIASITGSCKSTVKTRLFRARAQLRKSLEDREEAIC